MNSTEMKIVIMAWSATLDGKVANKSVKDSGAMDKKWTIIWLPRAKMTPITSE